MNVFSSQEDLFLWHLLKSSVLEHRFSKGVIKSFQVAGVGPALRVDGLTQKKIKQKPNNHPRKAHQNK